MQRRLFLKGIGGTIVGLPILESLVLDSPLQAATAPAPYVIFVYQPMGPEKDSWWPKQIGKLSADNLAGRGTAPLAPFASKINIIKGLGHGNERWWNQGDHGESTAMTLSGAATDKDNNDENQSKSRAQSIDHAIAKAFGGNSLNLSIVPNNGLQISWSGPRSPNSVMTDPMRVYRTLFPNGESMGGSQPVVDEKAALRKGVNDAVKDQITALLKSPKLSGDDKARLELHFQNIRDIEQAIMTEAIMPTADRQAIERFDSGQLNNNSSRKTTPKMMADLIAIAAATGQRRALTLMLGHHNLDQEFDDNGDYHGNNWHNGVSHGNDVAKLKKWDLLCQKNFAYLLTALNNYTFESNGKTLLDYGVTTHIISLGFGQLHWRHDLPHVVAGSANGFLKTGNYIDLIPTISGETRKQKFIPTNRLFSTIGKAVGAAGTEDFNAGTAPRDADKRVSQKGMIPEIIA